MDPIGLSECPPPFEWLCRDKNGVCKFSDCATCPSNGVCSALCVHFYACPGPEQRKERRWQEIRKLLPEAFPHLSEQELRKLYDADPLEIIKKIRGLRLDKCEDCGAQHDPQGGYQCERCDDEWMR